MIYLIGIDHKIQHKGISSADFNLIDKFINYLKNIIREYKITLIAEEFNEDCLSLSNINSSIAQNIAISMKIRHMFCEPSLKKRKEMKILSPNEIKSKKLGIKIDRDLNKDEQEIYKNEEQNSFSIRETFWFNSIKKYLTEEIIFLCGDEHLKRFKNYLIGEGCEAIIFSKNWGNFKDTSGNRDIIKQPKNLLIFL